jgi:methyl-accepting chemotaxis protein
VQRADSGVGVARELHRQVEAVIARVGQIDAAMEEIAAAGVAQADAVRRLAASPERVAGVTRQTRERAAEAEHTAHALTGQARTLAALIGRFTLDRSPAPRPEVARALATRR